MTAFPDHSIAGAFVSRLIVTLDDELPPSEIAVQLNTALRTSARTTSSLQPMRRLINDSSSTTSQWIATSDVYHPLFDVPLTCGVMMGAVWSSNCAESGAEHRTARNKINTRDHSRIGAPFFLLKDERALNIAPKALKD